jgi:hypothetical protein
MKLWSGHRAPIAANQSPKPSIIRNSGATLPPRSHAAVRPWARARGSHVSQFARLLRSKPSGVRGPVLLPPCSR